MGHSFGGAVAIRVAVGLSEMVAGVVTFATQSAGCEVAGGLQGKPLLMFHGDNDSILPAEASEMVRTIAGYGDLRRIFLKELHHDNDTKERRRSSPRQFESS
jgi:pimeloyl-ACP methyl ester carboxylesterase